MEQGHDTGKRRKLVTVNAEEETLNPNDLEGQDITILKVVDAAVPGGRPGLKGIVQRADDSLGVYWVPGTNVILSVGLWFQQNPGEPLPCRLYRKANKFGTSVWHIEQREEGEGGANASPQGQASESLDAQLTEIGL